MYGHDCCGRGSGTATVMGVVGYGVVGLSYLMADHLSALEASLSSTKP